MRAYDVELVSGLGRALPALVGVYAGGSIVLGDYVPGRSDLDRFVVVEEPLARDTKDAVVAAVRHEALPCPARGLELVVYTRGAAARPSGGGDFELNLNTGARMAFHASFDPADEPSHWFVLDRAIVRAHGRALVGPAPADVFGPVPRPVILRALASSLRWHAENAGIAGENVVLNAARAWRFAETADWAAKADAAAWARERGADGDLVEAALAAREGREGPPPDPRAALRFLDEVLRRVERAERPRP